MTSDHRAAGSSPAGCKTSIRADRLAIMHLKNQSQKSAVIRLLSGFPVLLAFLTAHVRTNPRNLLTCGFAVFVTIDERNTAIMNPAGQPKARQTQCAVIGYR